MRLVSVDELMPGMVIARAIHDDNYRLLVGEGVALVDSIIERLRRQGYVQVFIEEPGTEDVIPPEMVSDKVRHQVSRILNRSFDKITGASEIKEVTIQDVSKLLDEGEQYENVINVADIKTIVKNIIDDLVSNNTASFESPLFRGYLGRHYEHALNTTILCLLIGRQYRFNRKELDILGVGAVMHDIGKMLMPSILEKNATDLDEREQELIKQHPLLGGKLLNNFVHATYSETACVEQHHECQDGTGYPRGMKGSNSEPVQHRSQVKGNIYRMAEILQVSNVYDNLMNPTVTAPPLSPMRAVEEIINMAGSKLNSHIVGNTVTLINIFPVGASIRLTSHFSEDLIGATGVVVKGNAGYPDRPWIVLLFSRKGQRFEQQIKINLLEKKHIAIALEIHNK